MKQMILITGVILLSCVIMTSVVVPANAQLGTAAETAQTARETEEENTYVLKSCDGVLAVYVKGEQEPTLMTDTYTAVLPKDDQKRLREGIEVQGEQELKRALEDYCS